MQFVIKTTNDFQSLFDISNKLTEKAKKVVCLFISIIVLKFNQPEINLNINRSKASEMGLDMRAIGTSLTSALSGNYVNYFNLEGRSYQVIPQLIRPISAYT